MLTPHVRPARQPHGARRRSVLARAGTVAATVLALVLTLPGTAIAAPGDLDPTFSGDGKVLTGFADDDHAGDVAVQSDGKIVSVGASVDFSVLESRFALTRHNTDGTPDTTFGGDGTVTTPINNMDPDLQWSEAHALALQPDGKIVVAGSSWRGSENCCWFTVARYNTDGTLDSGFGGGDGRVFTDFGGPDEARDVAVQPDGKIVAAGFGGAGVALARYNADGSPDTGFGGGDGQVSNDPAPELPEEGGDGRALALQSDGKIVVGGQVGTTRFDFTLLRYTTNGTLDTSFSGDGIERTDFGDYESVEGLAVQSDGKVVAAGGSGGSFALARYNTNGTLDTSFDGDGRVLTPGGGAADVKLQPSDGRIVVAGSNGPGGNFAVRRYNPDGSQDSAFGTGGVATADFGGSDAARGVALQSDGKIVAAGGGGPNSSFALARFEGGGTAPPPPAGADLSVTKSGPATVSIGDRPTYSVRVTNNSTTTSATNVSLSDTFSGVAVSVVSATTSSGTCTTTATGASCSLGTLAPGAAATVTVAAEPRATGTLTDRATVSATQTDPNAGNNAATATTTVNNARGCTRVGTSGNDTITGTYGNDVICALGGDDTVDASYGNDTVHGGYGNDRLDGGFGNDTLNGGPGNDNLIGNYGTDNLNTVDSVSGNDTANGGFNTDTCTTDTGDIRISCP
ncbi:calcium-binding protein [Streptomyces sp. NBC_00638]|uniref:calcium-binding protein n=1 Tax=unclassified Streptomyces TaxID=2593676 RepID=UPI00224D7B75|nr:calcium-binding protein [Streptomyces sp. NBC_00638]MCX5008692.1 calcium-binding protein [Streptomyces sp. NBC_00638]